MGLFQAAQRHSAFASLGCALLLTTGLGHTAEANSTAETVTTIAVAPQDQESRVTPATIEQQIQADIIRRFRGRAETGDAESLMVLGYVHEVGRGVPQDFVLAHKWYNLAAAHGDQTGAMLREELASKMTPDLILKAQRMAREWLAAQQGGETRGTVSRMDF